MKVILMSFKPFGFMLLTISFFIQTTYADPPLPTPVGRVVWIKGILKAVMPNKEERKLQQTSLIYLKDTLITDANTQAQIVFTDQTLMTFRPNTNFYIDQYEYHAKPKNGSVGTYVMNLIEGGFRTITGLIAKNKPSDYQVNTPVATIGVRGTDYAVYIKNGEMYVGYFSGSPCVKNKQGEQCLDPNVRYVRVPSPQSPPVPVKEQPAVLKETLDIIPAKIAPFTGYDSGGSGGSGSIGSGGTVSSFCIQ